MRISGRLTTKQRTLSEAFHDTVKSLRNAKVRFGQGTTDVTEEAGYLLSYVVHLAPEDLNLYRDRHLTVYQEQRLRAVLASRINNRVPASYITREGWLRGIRFLVTRQVIIPRSHIAFLLGKGIRTWMRRQPRSVLDLCTGSGCLAVIAALEYPRASIDAIDISRNATRLARKNAELHGVSDRMKVVESDLYSAVASKSYDLIICNPPYVSERSLAGLPPEFLHEPRSALFGGDKDGLSLVRRILHTTESHLNAGGVLICEVGDNRRRLERQYPRVPFLWLDTHISGADVFLLTKGAFPSLG